jgi:hypothetical protein
MDKGDKPRAWFQDEFMFDTSTRLIQVLCPFVMNQSLLDVRRLISDHDIIPGYDSLSSPRLDSPRAFANELEKWLFRNGQQATYNVVGIPLVLVISSSVSKIIVDRIKSRFWICRVLPGCGGNKDDIMDDKGLGLEERLPWNDDRTYHGRNIIYSGFMVNHGRTTADV